MPPPTPWPEETGVWATYALHCHCGAIRYNITISPPLLESEAQACHPLAKNVEFTQGLEHRKEYRCGRGICPHWICERCGNVVGSDLTAIEKMFGGEARNTINLRMLKDVSLDQLSIKKSTVMKGAPPEYRVD
ncbi:hypothetical protein B0A48_00754 [Cryoendolithus antarcticus]|uniref:CENP-V/GFA domain-containing protein n=1 Tax=Cryoendolithus antarcticus TaxID=1507870 RepID=A0A1V8TR90_9PEZI|nr:hypothetical protein B0A48_00754 [Cryoendolithus antarcticus]